MVENVEILIDGIDRTNRVMNFSVNQSITEGGSGASLKLRMYETDDFEIASYKAKVLIGAKWGFERTERRFIFGGYVLKMKKTDSAEGIILELECGDALYLFKKVIINETFNTLNRIALVSRTDSSKRHYNDAEENWYIDEIVEYLIATYNERLKDSLICNLTTMPQINSVITEEQFIEMTLYEVIELCSQIASCDFWMGEENKFYFQKRKRLLSEPELSFEQGKNIQKGETEEDYDSVKTIIKCKGASLGAYLRAEDKVGGSIGDSYKILTPRLGNSIENRLNEFVQIFQPLRSSIKSLSLIKPKRLLGSKGIKLRLERIAEQTSGLPDAQRKPENLIKEVIIPGSLFELNESISKDLTAENYFGTNLKHEPDTPESERLIRLIEFPLVAEKRVFVGALFSSAEGNSTYPEYCRDPRWAIYDGEGFFTLDDRVKFRGDMSYQLYNPAKLVRSRAVFPKELIVQRISLRFYDRGGTSTDLCSGMTELLYKDTSNLFNSICGIGLIFESSTSYYYAYIIGVTSIPRKVGWHHIEYTIVKKEAANTFDIILSFDGKIVYELLSKTLANFNGFAFALKSYATSSVNFSPSVDDVAIDAYRIDSKESYLYNSADFEIPQDWSSYGIVSFKLKEINFISLRQSSVLDFRLLTNLRQVEKPILISFPEGTEPSVSPPCSITGFANIEDKEERGKVSEFRIYGIPESAYEFPFFEQVLLAKTLEVPFQIEGLDINKKYALIMQTEGESESSFEVPVLRTKSGETYWRASGLITDRWQKIRIKENETPEIINEEFIFAKVKSPIECTIILNDVESFGEFGKEEALMVDPILLDDYEAFQIALDKLETVKAPQKRLNISSFDLYGDLKGRIVKVKYPRLLKSNEFKEFKIAKVDIDYSASGGLEATAELFEYSVLDEMTLEKNIKTLRERMKNQETEHEIAEKSTIEVYLIDTFNDINDWSLVGTVIGNPLTLEINKQRHGAGCMKLLNQAGSVQFESIERSFVPMRDFSKYQFLEFYFMTNITGPKNPCLEIHIIGEDKDGIERDCSKGYVRGIGKQIRLPVVAQTNNLWFKILIKISDELLDDTTLIPIKKDKIKKIRFTNIYSGGTFFEAWLDTLSGIYSSEIT